MMTTQTDETAAQVRAQALGDAAQAHRDIDDKSATGGLTVGEQLSEGDQSGEVVEIRYKRLVRRWHTETGRMFKTLPYMVDAYSKEVFKDTNRGVWVFRDPGIISVGEGLRCHLHLDEPDSERFRKMGFGSCKKNHLPYEDARELHMEKKHKRAWKAIQGELVKQAKKDADEFQKMMMTTLAAVANQGAGGSGAGVGGTVVPAEVEDDAMASPTATEMGQMIADIGADASARIEAATFPADVEPESDDPFSVKCPHCEHVATAKSQAGVLASLRGHEKREHPPE